MAEYGLLGLLGASLALCLASCDPKEKEEEASSPRVYAECNLTGEPQEAELDVGATGFKSIHWVDLEVIAPAERFRGGGPGAGQPNWLNQYLIRAIDGHEIEVAFVVTPVSGPIFEGSAFTIC
ncbi:MAG: hypothetical protein AAFW75_19915 [Cyanobacteria bacterium J06636_16]